MKKCRIREGLATGIALLLAVTCRDWDALSKRYAADSSAPDAATDSSALDAATDSSELDAAPDDGATDPCPTGRGPQMVRVSLLPDAAASPVDFCIDGTEVTRAQYAEFLAAVGNDVSGQPPECDWNQDYVAPLPEPLDAPIARVDHCDARAFCAWAGKRLCSGSGANWLGDPLRNEHYFACSKGIANVWPYGAEPKLGYCAFKESASEPAVVASLKMCEGAFAGLFDLTGNVWEWIDACEQTDAGGPRCHFRGGSFKSDYDSYTCGAIGYAPPDYREDDVGFRCCASVD